MIVVAVVFDVVPSPNDQTRFVMMPVEASVNVTASGATPLVGVAVKFAHDQMQLPFWALTGWFVYRAITGKRALDWIVRYWDKARRAGLPAGSPGRTCASPSACSRSRSVPGEAARSSRDSGRAMKRSPRRWQARRSRSGRSG